MSVDLNKNVFYRTEIRGRAERAITPKGLDEFLAAVCLQCDIPHLLKELQEAEDEIKKLRAAITKLSDAASLVLLADCRLTLTGK